MASKAGAGSAVLGALVAAGTPLAAGAGELTVSPSLEGALSYTDNVALAPPGQEKGDLVTEVNPAVTVRGEGNRARGRVDYRMQNLFYADDSDRNTTFHQLAARGTGEVVPRTFHVDANATYAQQVISPGEAVPTSNLTVSDNRTDVFTTGVSPYLMHQFGDFARGRARYSYQRVEYGGEEFDSQSYTTTASLENGPVLDRWGWRLDGSDRRVTYDDRPDSRFRQGRGELRLRVGPSLQLFGSGGVEDNQFERSAGREAPDGAFWEAGFHWSPSRRTSVEGALGERYYGETKRAELTHETRHTNWSLSYREELTTLTQLQTERQVFMVTDESGQPVLDADQEPILVSLEFPALTTEVYLRKRYSASVTARTAKSTVSLSGFNERRTFQTSDEVEQVKGGRANWRWDFGSRTWSDLGFNFLRRSFPGTAREDDLWFAHARLHRDIRRNIEGSVGYERVERDASGGGTDYRQNIVSLRARARF